MIHENFKCLDGKKGASHHRVKVLERSLFSFVTHWPRAARTACPAQTAACVTTATLFANCLREA